MRDLYKDISSVYKQTETKKLLLTPAIKRALPKSHSNAKLIDIGCGTGDFYNLTTNLGYKYYGLDRSKSMLSVAKEKHPKGNFSLWPATNFANKYKIKFDIALLNLVLQDNDKQNELNIIKETAKSLKKSGLAVVGIHHPNFDHYMRFGLLNQSNVKTNFRGYFTSDQKYFLKYYYDDKPVNFIDYHLTLQEYFEMFIKNGFEIVSVDECLPTKFDNVSNKKILEKSLYPTYMVITLRKG